MIPAPVSHTPGMKGSAPVRGNGFHIRTIVVNSVYGMNWNLEKEDDLDEEY